MSVTATLAWARTESADVLDIPVESPVPVVASPTVSLSPTPVPTPSPTASAVSPSPFVLPTTTVTRSRATYRPLPAATGEGTDRLLRGPTESATRDPDDCQVGSRLVPTCGILWGVAPGARTERRGQRALAEFERKTGRPQAIFHGYHRGIRQMFPTEQEIAIAREPGRKRILLLNWKPETATWAKIARGDRRTDEFLDRLAVHLKENFRERFFFAVHHEAEDQVRERPGSGYTARDYAAMFRHVVKRLRAKGATNVVTVLVHMAYVPHTTRSWFQHMYPGDDVVDWIGFDTYSYSDPGYGHGDFAELLNRRSASKPGWPGFYNWVSRRHPSKPLMIAEWGVWFSKRNPDHMAEFYREVGEQIADYPGIKAMVHFETPANHKRQDSRVDSTPDALREYRRLGRLPVFQVSLG
ncbi:Glycosyl hydrolase family 26 [Actinoplanes derwentensis]|uniref:Glycosyl hydrolase family 26 n=2 Tax=Actinoplanes derwentensis TaxID=113562 RepID=A0A1H2CK19_9ACTN|nr:Glycosyl hydrolase family 26 [Actinoplanes derwentensis]